MTRMYPEQGWHRWLVAAFLVTTVAAPASGTPDTLRYQGIHTDNVGGVDGLAFAFRVASSPDGRHVYVTGGSDTAIAVFARNVERGTLSLQQVVRGGTVHDVEVSPDGLNVYVTGGGNANASPPHLRVFTRDPVNGHITFVESDGGATGAPGLVGASEVVVSPDGLNVYVGSIVEDALVVFSRDLAGRLTFLEIHRDGIGSTTALNGVGAVAISPDGKYVYTGAYVDNAITVFARSPATGRLTYNGVYTAPAVSALTVAGDGIHLYATEYLSSAVAAFVRDVGTGALSPVQVVTGGAGSLANLSGPTNIVVSPDGTRAYVCAWLTDALLVFARNADTGILTFIESWQNGVGVDGLDGVISAAVTPDNNNVYTAGFWADSLAEFAVLIFADDFE